MRIVWHALAAVLWLAGCESIIDVEQTEPYAPKVVVRGIFAGQTQLGVSTSASVRN